MTISRQTFLPVSSSGPGAGLRPGPLGLILVDARSAPGGVRRGLRRRLVGGRLLFSKSRFGPDLPLDLMDPGVRQVGDLGERQKIIAVEGAGVLPLV